MKRDARIGLAVVLVAGLAVTLLVARSIHQNGAQAGIDQDPAPERETASANQTAPDSGATLDPAYDAQAKVVMEFQTQHEYAPAPIAQATGGSSAGTIVDIGPEIAAIPDRNRIQTATSSQTLNTSNGMLPPVGQPPVHTFQQTQQAPTANDLGTYTIASGDNPWKISVKVFGDGKYAQKIVDANSGLNPAKLRIGQKISIPAIPNATPRMTLENAIATSIPGHMAPLGGQGMPQDFNTGTDPMAHIGVAPQATTQTHIVVAGDTLGKMAAKYMGSSGPKSVKKLQDANPGLNAKRLKIGQEIRIPAQ